MYSIKNLHYLFRRKINKVDSLQNKNFFVEQIDSYLNEALLIFIESILKFAESDQNKIEYINQLIENQILEGGITQDKYVDFLLPVNYYRHLNSYSIVDRCDAELNHYPVQYDDLNYFLNDTYYSPSIEWRETGYYLVNDKIRIYTNNDFGILKVVLNYIKKHPLLGNPENSRLGAYTLPDGSSAVQQDLLLDNRNQFDIISDIAVLIASIDMTDQNYQIKLNKILQEYVSK